MKKFDKDFPIAANYANDKMYEEAWKMYDSFIDQYYQGYATHTYIRHGETKPGTRHGINLYRGSQIRRKGKGTKNPSLIIEFSGEDMEDDYQYDSADFVLQNVMAGYRGIPGYWIESWGGTYDGKYFQYSGTPERAFDIFNEQYNNIMMPIFFEKWRSLGWK